MVRLRITLLALAALPLLLAAPPAGAQSKDPPAPAPPNERIIGGHAPTRAWPAQVSVQFTLPGQGTFQCGGTLVSGRWVATAAHCAEDGGDPIAASAYTLRVGSANRRAGGEVFEVDRVELHSEFETNLGGAPENDVALLHLASAGASFEPLRLVRADETGLWAPGVTATVIGWGQTVNGGPTVDQLQQGEVTIVSDATCSQVYDGPPSNPFRATTMVCAGGGSTDTCGGDSGGPLMVPRAGDFVLAGITSWGPERCALPGVPGVYTRVGAPALNQWIRDRIPTVSFSASPASVEAGQQVNFTANRTAPPSQPGEASFEWDLDGDGQYDDASGPTAARVYTDPGTTAVRVQTTYPDGDRAVARELVTVTPAPPPPPPPPPDTSAPTAPATAVTPTAPTAPLASAAARPRVLVTSRLRLLTLRTTGVRARVICARACSISARLTLDARTARRFGLTRRSAAVTIGRATARLDAAGTRTVRVRLTARARGALRRLRSATIVLRTDVLSGATRTREARRIAVRR